MRRRRFIELAAGAIAGAALGTQMAPWPPPNAMLGPNSLVASGPIELADGDVLAYSVGFLTVSLKDGAIVVRQCDRNIASAPIPAQRFGMRVLFSGGAAQIETWPT